MFGTLRLLLACLVALSHLVGSADVAHFGFYAVRGFFVLSGFLLTAALNEVYGFDAGRFWTNRLLRILPPYYVVCVLTFVAIALAPTGAAEFLKFWQPNPRPNDVLANLAVLPLQFTEARFRLVPPVWSIAVELVLYFALWAVIARREAWAWLGLVAGIAYHTACLYDGFAWGAVYFTAPSALLSFSLGALVYFWRRTGWLQVGPRAVLPALAAWLGNMVAGGSILPDSYVLGHGYYLGTILFSILVAGLAGWAPGARLRAIDRALGDLAYPVFLVHWLTAFLVASAFFPGTWRGWTLAAAATPAILALATVLAVLTRRYVEPLRSRLRGAPSELLSRVLGPA